MNEIENGVSYSEEFKAEAVRMLTSSKLSHSIISQRLGVSQERLRSWLYPRSKAEQLGWMIIERGFVVSIFILIIGIIIPVDIVARGGYGASMSLSAVIIWEFLVEAFRRTGRASRLAPYIAVIIVLILLTVLVSFFYTPPAIVH